MTRFGRAGGTRPSHGIPRRAQRCRATAFEADAGWPTSGPQTAEWAMKSRAPADRSGYVDRPYLAFAALLRPAPSPISLDAASLPNRHRPATNRPTVRLPSTYSSSLYLHRGGRALCSLQRRRASRRGHEAEVPWQLLSRANAATSRRRFPSARAAKSVARPLHTAAADIGLRQPGTVSPAFVITARARAGGATGIEPQSSDRSPNPRARRSS
jgi:hypothetical protein